MYYAFPVFPMVPVNILCVRDMFSRRVVKIFQTFRYRTHFTILKSSLNRHDIISLILNSWVDVETCYFILWSNN